MFCKRPAAGNIPVSKIVLTVAAKAIPANISVCPTSGSTLFSFSEWSVLNTA
jgi:hypothetical protein